MELTTRALAPSAAVRTVAVDDNLVLVDQKSGQYFGLNEVGREIWRLVEQGRDAPAIIRTLAEQFDAAEDVIAIDTQRLLGELVEAGLIAG